MNQRERALCRLSAEQFVLWELHLYLDTHPDDDGAKLQHEEVAERVEELRRDYEACFGGLSPRTASGREWLKNPWPWDLEREEM